MTASFFTPSLNLRKLARTGANLSTSNLSTSVCRLAKFVFSAKLEVSACQVLLISSFLAQLERSTVALIFHPELLNGLGKY